MTTPLLLRKVTFFLDDTQHLLPSCDFLDGVHIAQDTDGSSGRDRARELYYAICSGERHRGEESEDFSESGLISSIFKLANLRFIRRVNIVIPPSIELANDISSFREWLGIDRAFHIAPDLSQICLSAEILVPDRNPSDWAEELYCWITLLNDLLRSLVNLTPKDVHLCVDTCGRQADDEDDWTKDALWDRYGLKIPSQIVSATFHDVWTSGPFLPQSDGVNWRYIYSSSALDAGGRRVSGLRVLQTGQN